MRTAAGNGNTFEAPSPSTRLERLAADLPRVSETRALIEETRRELGSGQASQFSQALAKLNTMEQVVFTNRDDFNKLLIRINFGTEAEKFKAIATLKNYEDLALKALPELERISLKSSGELKTALLGCIGRISADRLESLLLDPRHATDVINFIADKNPGRILELRLSKDPAIHAAAEWVYNDRQMRFAPEDRARPKQEVTPTADRNTGVTELASLSKIAEKYLPNSEVAEISSVHQMGESGYYGYAKRGTATFYFHSSGAMKLQPDDAPAGTGVTFSAANDTRIPKPRETIVLYSQKEATQTNAVIWGFGDRLIEIADNLSKN